MELIQYPGALGDGSKELREQENILCSRTRSAECTAACPVHVDVRGLIAAITKGDYAAAA
jgi:L-lactate utilization protein LutB